MFLVTTVGRQTHAGQPAAIVVQRLDVAGVAVSSGSNQVAVDAGAHHLSGGPGGGGQNGQPGPQRLHVDDAKAFIARGHDKQLGCLQVGGDRLIGQLAQPAHVVALTTLDHLRL
jgi:hypothetical protein